ncbi:cytochrome P450 4c21-like isoform X2 [Culicoides brevitarsis]|uniref:cytochrome P450 4c21-like isoform X2 n=1 Tax=Culicoides brevitarsis TaxID=469753 RepID=UPI00307CA37C
MTLLIDLTTSLYLILFSIIFYFILKQIKFIKAVNRIPGVWGPLRIQLFGVALEFLGKTEAERLKLLQGYAEAFPKVGKVWFGHMFVCYLHDPELLQQVYTSKKCLEKPFFYKFFGFGDGLITAKVKSWKGHRKILNNAFSQKNLQGFISIFDESSKQYVKSLEENLGKGPFDMLNYAVKATLDSICATSFGINVKAQEKKLNFNAHLQRIHELTAIRMFNLHLYSDFIYRLSKYWPGDIVARSHCLQFGQELVKKRRQELMENNNNGSESGFEEENCDLSKKSEIFVDHLLKSKDANNVETFTDNQIRDHVLTILSAGNETTALGVSFGTLFLAMHPEVQERAYQEVKEVYGTTGDVPITYENLRKLEYMDRVIKETLRLAPSVPLISRIMTEDTYFDNGVMLPKGTHTLVVIYALHRLKCYWGENADKFDPDNFLPEKVAARHPFCYLPFSSGIRNCIGQKYAVLSMKVMLVNLLLAYKFETPLKMEDLEFRLDVSLMLTNPYSIEITKR